MWSCRAGDIFTSQNLAFYPNQDFGPIAADSVLIKGRRPEPGPSMYRHGGGHSAGSVLHLDVLGSCRIPFPSVALGMGSRDPCYRILWLEWGLFHTQDRLLFISEGFSLLKEGRISSIRVECFPYNAVTLTDRRLYSGMFPMSAQNYCS